MTYLFGPSVFVLIALLDGIVHCGFFSVKINGGRHVTGVLRGFDPFMNLVLDEAVEEVSAQEKHNIGMVVSEEHPFVIVRIRQ